MHGDRTSAHHRKNSTRGACDGASPEQAARSSQGCPPRTPNRGAGRLVFRAMRPGRAEARLFRALNAVLEPSVRKGFGSPPLAPGALIVLETTGHRTGRLSKV